MSRLGKEKIRELEASHFSERSLESSAEIGEVQTYEWFEDLVMKKQARVEFKKTETGLESASIIKKNDQTDEEEIAYYTTQPTEVEKLKAATEGKTIIVEE